MTRLNIIEGTDEYWIVGLSMKVRNELGFSMLESVYERALMQEFQKAGMPAERQVMMKVYYDGRVIDGYRADIVVDNRIVLELKTVSRLYAVHRRQIRSYLEASGIKSGLLINLGSPRGLECERFERRGSCDSFPGICPIPDTELFPVKKTEDAESGSEWKPESKPEEDTASLSLTERVSRILGSDI